jgi:hypothetical protein
VTFGGAGAGFAGFSVWAETKEASSNNAGTSFFNGKTPWDGKQKSLNAGKGGVNFVGTGVSPVLRGDPASCSNHGDAESAEISQRNPFKKSL